MPDWQAVFSRAAPLAVEIGCGYGEAAAALAQSRPQDNFVALEVYAPGIGALLNRLAVAGLQNVRVVRADAATALPLLFADGALCGVRVFFPTRGRKSATTSGGWLMPHLWRCWRKKFNRAALCI